jgi:transporter family-2 protein
MLARSGSAGHAACTGGTGQAALPGDASGRDLTAAQAATGFPDRDRVEENVPQPVLWGLFATAAAGAGVSFVMQQAVNADLRSSLGSAAWAGFVSYLGGTLCMLALAAVLRDWPPPVAAMPGSHWWAWSGGLFGAIYIAVSILLVQRLGAAGFIALLVGGQMLASLAFDHFGLFGLPRQPLDMPRLLGAALLVAGVALVKS